MNHKRKLTPDYTERPTLKREIRLRHTRGLLILIGVVCVLSFSPLGVRAENMAPDNESQRFEARLSGTVRTDYAMPERLERQVAPAPSEPWLPPNLSGYTSVLKSAERSPIDLQKRYNLVELIDLAQRLNPETRVAWEAARQAAIGVGLVESTYLPVLALTAIGG
jgi:hypothetical protein